MVKRGPGGPLCSTTPAASFADSTTKSERRREKAIVFVYSFRSQRRALGGRARGFAIGLVGIATSCQVWCPNREFYPILENDLYRLPPVSFYRYAARGFSPMCEVRRVPHTRRWQRLLAFGRKRNFALQLISHALDIVPFALIRGYQRCGHQRCGPNLPRGEQGQEWRGDAAFGAAVRGARDGQRR